MRPEYRVAVPALRGHQFDGFWKTGNFDVHNTFMCGCVKVFATKRKGGRSASSRRQYSSVMIHHKQLSLSHLLTLSQACTTKVSSNKLLQTESRHCYISTGSLQLVLFELPNEQGVLEADNKEATMDCSAF